VQGQGVFEGDRFVRIEGLFDAVQRLLRNVGWQDVAHVFPDELIGLDQQLAGVSRVVVEICAEPVDHEHQVRNGPENRAVTTVALVERVPLPAGGADTCGPFDHKNDRDRVSAR